MNAGMSFVAGGSWDPAANSGAGGLVSSNGLVSADKSEAGFINLNLLYPVDAGNVACLVTRRGTGTNDVRFQVVQTSDSQKSVLSYVSTVLTDCAFDFLFVRFAQPTQG